MFSCIRAEYGDFLEIILYLQANPYRLQTKNMDSLIFTSAIIKLMLNIFFCFIGLVSLRKIRKGLVVY